MSKWVKGTVLNLRQWTDELYSLQIEVQVAPFIAGQFTRLAMDIDGEHVARPYSFVNGPDNPVHEFYFITVPHGPLTHQMIHLKAGDTIDIAERGAGLFTLKDIPDADNLWMLSTGTAIGPFLSILSTQEVWRRFRQIVLIHAVRTVQELTYQELIAEIAAKHPEQFQMIPFVSREDTDFAIKGRIPRAIEDGQLEQRAGIAMDAEHSQVMICGNPAMVRDTSRVLTERGLKKNLRREPGQITVEKYWKDSG